MQLFNPFDPFGMFGVFAVFAFVMPLLVCTVFIVIFMKIVKGTGRAVDTFVTSMPSFAGATSISTRSDGADLRTVRLPSKCPSCGADLSPEGIDWVGPLEAKCSYCGTTVHAKLERL